MKPIIEANEVSRWYGIVMGLNNVSFQMEPGLTGLVGPNGAGKSTLIQIITGQLEASSGELKVFGERPWNNVDVLRRIGFCPEKEAVHQDLKPLHWLQSLGMLSGMSSSAAKKRSKVILERVKLHKNHWNKPLGQYSKGMRQRVKLAQALMHEPDLLVLDEPMNGLDPMGRQEVSDILRDLVAEGVSVLISSHILPELEPLCRNIIIINWGKLLATGAQKKIRSDIKNWAEQLFVRCSDPEKLVKHLFEAGMLVGFHLESSGGGVTLQIKDPAQFYLRWTQILIDSEVTLFEALGQSRSLKNIFDKVTT